MVAGNILMSQKYQDDEGLKKGRQVTSALRKKALAQVVEMLKTKHF